MSQAARAEIVRILKETDGFIQDSGGAAGKRLAEKMTVCGYAATMNALKGLEADGVIEKVTGSGDRRTFRIALTGLDLPALPPSQSVAGRPRAPRRRQVEPPTAEEVAAALLDLTLKRIDEATAAQVDRAATRGLERKLSDAEATIVELRRELSTLQMKKRETDERSRDLNTENQRLKKGNQRLAAQLQELQQENGRLKLGVARSRALEVPLEERLDPKSRATLDAVRNGGR